MPAGLIKVSDHARGLLFSLVISVRIKTSPADLRNLFPVGRLTVNVWRLKNLDHRRRQRMMRNRVQSRKADHSPAKVGVAVLVRIERLLTVIQMNDMQKLQTKHMIKPGQ